jgi:hypothetical protein
VAGSRVEEDELVPFDSLAAGAVNGDGDGDVTAAEDVGAEGDFAGVLKGLAGRSAGVGSTVSFAASERSFGLSQPVGTRTIPGRIARLARRRNLPIFAFILIR